MNLPATPRIDLGNTATDEQRIAAEGFARQFADGMIVTIGNGKTKYRVVEVLAWRINLHYPANESKCLRLENIKTGRRSHSCPVDTDHWMNAR